MTRRHTEDTTVQFPAFPEPERHTELADFTAAIKEALVRIERSGRKLSAQIICQSLFEQFAFDSYSDLADFEWTSYMIKPDGHLTIGQYVVQIDQKKLGEETRFEVLVGKSTKSSVDPSRFRS